MFLLSTGVGLLLGTSKGRTRVVVGYVLEGCNAVGMNSKGGERLVGSAPPAVSAGKGEFSGLDVVLFLKIVAD